MYHVCVLHEYKVRYVTIVVLYYVGKVKMLKLFLIVCFSCRSSLFWQVSTNPSEYTKHRERERDRDRQNGLERDRVTQNSIELLMIKQILS